LVATHHFLEPIARRGRAGLHRLIIQVALYVGGEAAGRFIAAIAVLLQGLHHDPIELPANQLRQLGRFHVALGRD
jgi:hypothetical protein